MLTQAVQTLTEVISRVVKTLFTVSSQLTLYSTINQLPSGSKTTCWHSKISIRKPMLLMRKRRRRRRRKKKSSDRRVLLLRPVQHPSRQVSSDGFKLNLFAVFMRLNAFLQSLNSSNVMISTWWIWSLKFGCCACLLASLLARTVGLGLHRSWRDPELVDGP